MSALTRYTVVITTDDPMMPAHPVQVRALDRYDAETRVLLVYGHRCRVEWVTRGWSA